MTTETKCCTVCKNEFPNTTEFFYRRHRKPDSPLRARCKKCSFIYAQIDRENRKCPKVYKVVLPDEHYYIGSTLEPMIERLRRHFYTNENNRLTSLGQYAHDRGFTRDDVAVEVQDCLSAAHAQELERELIIRYKDDPYLLNVRV